MAGERSTDLVKLLVDNELLLPSQTENQCRTLAAQVPDARALAGELLRCGWLTALQANLLLQGKARELVIGPYRLLDRIGQGGMGQVYKARHVRMGRIAALKVIHRDRLTSPTALERFTREVRAVAQLSHPNIVLAYEAGVDGDTHYLAMEYVEGQDLAHLVKHEGPRAVPASCEFARQAALGLQHAHEKGLVHRDIKPANLLLQRESGVVKILDFGLARFASETATKGNLTQIGRFVGTVDYISPEQAGDPRKADIRSDIYSLGCCLFYLLVGRPPFEGTDMVARIAARVLGDAPPLRSVRPDAPAGLEQIVARMLARDLNARYRSPAEVASALAPFAAVPKEALQTKQAAVAVAQVVRPAAIRLEPVAALAVPVGGDSAPMMAAPEPLIVRKTGRVRSGGWGRIAAACAVIALLGSGAAYWISKTMKEGEANPDPPENVAINRVPPDSPAKTVLPPLPETPAARKPKETTKPEPEPKSKNAPPKVTPKSEPAPNPTPDTVPPPSPAVAMEPELVPPPQLLAEVSAKPPAKPSSEVEKPRDPRTPVPDGATLAKTEADIRGLFKDDYKKLKHSELSAFAGRLLENADNAKEPTVERYVLLREARDVAARAADADLAYKAIDALAHDFAVDARAMKIEALDRAIHEAHTRDRSALLAERATSLLDEIADTDRYAEAVRLAKLAENAALRSGDTSLILAAGNRRKNLESVQKAFEDLKPAAAVLENKPDDPDANLAMGRFLCLLKGDWTQGLPHLVQCGDDRLRELAGKELGGLGSPEQEVELADAWRDFARKERGTARKQLLLHALSMYQKALPELSGTLKSKTTKSVEEIEKEFPPGNLAGGWQARFKGRWYVKYANRTVREYVFDAKGNVTQTAEATQDPNNKDKLINIRKMKRAGKLNKNENDVLLDFNDQQLERISMRGANLIVEHYNPRTQYPKEKPPLVGVGVRKR